MRTLDAGIGPVAPTSMAMESSSFLKGLSSRIESHTKCWSVRFLRAFISIIFAGIGNAAIPGTWSRSPVERISCAGLEQALGMPAKPIVHKGTRTRERIWYWLEAADDVVFA